MRTQPKVASSLAWWSLLSARPSRSRASAISHSAIHAASKRKYESLSSPHPKQRTTTLSSNGSFNDQNANLSPDQYRQCLSDLVAADGNRDGRLDKAEYIMFLSLNAENYGYRVGYAANQASLSELPLEFPMLFHTTACLCAYEQQPGVDFKCCEGENEHVVVYGGGGAMIGEGMTADEVAYTTLFCTEAFYSYGVTFTPTKSPTGRPTSSPETPGPTAKPSPAATPKPTGSPTMKPTGSPAAEPVTRAPTAKPVDVMPTKPTASPNAAPSTPAPTPLVVTPSPTKATAAPVKRPTASPTRMATPPPTPAASPVPTKEATAPPTRSPISSTKTPTASPNARPITLSPTEPPSSRPTSRPTTAAPTPKGATGTPTSSPAMTTKSPTESPTPDPTPSPTRDPTTPPTAKPTTLPTSSPSLQPTAGPVSSLLEIDITYGISSNCNMTAADIMNGNYGITIREGLEAATEAVLIEVLNETYPRDGTPVAMMEAPVADEGAEGASATGSHDEDSDGAEPTKMMSPGQGVRTRFGGLREHAVAESHASLGWYHPLAKSLPGEGVRMRVKGLPQKFGSRRDLAILEPHQQPHSERHYQSGNIGSLHRQRRRSLVYYTIEYPVAITEMEDVPCEPGRNCMRVRSGVMLVLEEGDDRVMIEKVVSERLQDSISDGSLFGKIPLDTVFCPPATDRPTNSPTQAAPTTWWPSFSPVATTRPTFSPVTPAPVTPSPVDPPTSSPVSPTASPTVSSVTDAPTYPRGPFEVIVQYEFQNDCGLTGALIMNEEGNTVKQGLIAATTTVTVRVLNETYPRADGAEPMRRNVRARGLAHLDLQSISSISSPSLSGGAQRQRNLVYYTDEYPVVIDRILDNTWSCAPGLNCLLATSTITVVLEPGDDGAEVSRTVVTGMQNSFKDESFYQAIPEDTVICP